MLAELESAWDCPIDDPIDGGTAAFVATAIDRGGHAAIVKVAIPSGGEGYSDFENELLVLTLAKHRSYVDVLEADVDRRVLLLERLGQPFTEAGMTTGPDRNTWGHDDGRLATRGLERRAADRI